MYSLILIWVEILVIFNYRRNYGNYKQSIKTVIYGYFLNLSINFLNIKQLSRVCKSLNKDLSLSVSLVPGISWFCSRSRKTRRHRRKNF